MTTHSYLLTILLRPWPCRAYQLHLSALHFIEMNTGDQRSEQRIIIRYASPKLTRNLSILVHVYIYMCVCARMQIFIRLAKNRLRTRILDAKRLNPTRTEEGRGVTASLIEPYGSLSCRTTSRPGSIAAWCCVYHSEQLDRKLEYCGRTPRGRFFFFFFFRGAVR